MRKLSSKAGALVMGVSLVALTACEEPKVEAAIFLTLIYISEPTRSERISYAVFCLKKKKRETNRPS